MRSACFALSFAIFMVLVGQQAAAADKTVVVKFKPGARSATVKGSLRGYDGVTYVIGANAGQAMSIVFSPKNSSCYFNVTAPGAEEALFNGSTTGNEFSANLDASGNYEAQVYLMRNAARRNETCQYSMTVEIGG
jgi:small nuclear ribonucleoprotein (snRNP)-like protein